jgi:hypothetical protein
MNVEPSVFKPDESKALKEARARHSSSSIIVSSTAQGAAKAKSYQSWDCTTEAPMRLSRLTKAVIDR